MGADMEAHRVINEATAPLRREVGRLLPSARVALDYEGNGIWRVAVQYRGPDNTPYVLCLESWSADGWQASCHEAWPEDLRQARAWEHPLVSVQAPRPMYDEVPLLASLVVALIVGHKYLLASAYTAGGRR